jgi:SecD/SecF fusion protein
MLTLKELISEFITGYAKVCLGKPTIVKDAKEKDIDAVELSKGNRDNVAAMSGGVVTDARFI